jgi:Spx/MgsR family transcriptional regulator
MPITLYGIPNCDTVKKARTWLNTKNLEHDFHDFKKSWVDEAHLLRWCDALGWEKVLNKAGTTFKKLADSDKTNLNQTKAIALMLAQPSMIKRPIVEHPGGLLIGFKADEWSAAIS